MTTTLEYQYPDYPQTSSRTVKPVLRTETETKPTGLSPISLSKVANLDSTKLAQFQKLNMHYMVLTGRGEKPSGSKLAKPLRPTERGVNKAVALEWWTLKQEELYGPKEKVETVEYEEVNEVRTYQGWAISGWLIALGMICFDWDSQVIHGDYSLHQACVFSECLTMVYRDWNYVGHIVGDTDIESIYTIAINDWRKDDEN